MNKNKIVEMLNEVYDRQGKVYLDMDACIIYDNAEVAERDGAWLIKEVDSIKYGTKGQFISAIECYME